MSHKHLILPAGFVLAVFLSSCTLSGTSGTVPPPPPEAVVPHPIETPTPTPAPGGKAGSGEIVFVADGTLKAMSPDGSNSRVIYTPVQGGVIRDLAVSPNGKYLALTVSGAQVVVLDLELAQSTTIATSAADRFSAPVWTFGSDALYYHQMVLGDGSRPVRSLVLRADMPPSTAEPLKVLDFDLANNMPIIPVASWRGGLLFLHQTDLGGATLGQWIVFDPTVSSLIPLYKDFGLWDVSPERTQMLLYNTADMASGASSPSVPVFSADLDLLRGAVSLNRMTPEDQQIHLEAAHYGPDGAHVAALQTVPTDTGFRHQLVLLSPIGGGKVAVSRLAPDDTADDVALAWGGAGVIVQRIRAGISELWMAPLDGSAAALLGPGEQPVVIPVH